MRQGIIFFVFVLIVCTIIGWLHHHRLKGFPTVYFRMTFIVTGAFIAIAISKISNKVKTAILGLFFAVEQVRVLLLSGVYGVTFFFVKKYWALRKLAPLIFGHNSLTFPKIPTIFLANYPSDIMEYLAIGVFPKQTSWVVHKYIGRYFATFFGKNRIILNDRRKKHTFDFIKKSIRKSVLKGYHIFAYPEKNYYTRKGIYSLAPFHSGLFTIAKELGITVTPVIIGHMEYEWPRRCKIHILDPIKINNVTKAKEYCWKVMERKLHFMKYHP